MDIYVIQASPRKLADIHTQEMLREGIHYQSFYLWHSVEQVDG